MAVLMGATKKTFKEKLELVYNRIQLCQRAVNDIRYEKTYSIRSEKLNDLTDKQKEILEKINKNLFSNYELLDELK